MLLGDQENRNQCNHPHGELLPRTAMLSQAAGFQGNRYPVPAFHAVMWGL